MSFIDDFGMGSIIAHRTRKMCVIADSMRRWVETKRMGKQDDQNAGMATQKSELPQPLIIESNRLRTASCSDRVKK